MSGRVGIAFVDLVEHMRKAQKAWYEEKDQSKLQEAMQLEIQVDKAILDIREDQRRVVNWTRGKLL